MAAREAPSGAVSEFEDDEDMVMWFAKGARFAGSCRVVVLCRAR
jgi:hypothetical protein